jgi:gluconate 2-dehydrogenase gamma chain
LREHSKRLVEAAGLHTWLSEWRGELLSRRRFLLRMAGGTAAALYPWAAGGEGGSTPELDEAARWRVLDTVQQHMLPGEPEAPGAREIKALNYLRFIVADDTQDAEERAFILQGAVWLEDMARKLAGTSFLDLDEARREQVLRKIEASSAGRNWLSTMLLYLIEALLADPVYGGNADGLGWRWLAHIPGYPRPPADKRYPELLRR